MIESFLIATIAFALGYAAHWLASRDERETFKLLVGQQHEATMQRLGWKPRDVVTHGTKPTTKMAVPATQEPETPETPEEIVRRKLGSLKPPDLLGMRQEAINEQNERAEKLRKMIM